MCSLCTVPQLPSFKSIDVWTRSHTQWLPSNDTGGINIEQMEKTHQDRAEILKLSWGHDRIKQHGCNETATHRHVYYKTMYLENNFWKEGRCCSSLTKKKTIWKKDIVCVRKEDMATSFRAAERGMGEIDLTVFVLPQQREEQPSANCSETEHINLLMTRQQHRQIENIEEEEEGSL